MELAELLDAVAFASRAHQGQHRGDGCTPYAAHPVRVALILATAFGERRPEVLAAALLHDTIEDTGVDRDEVAERIGEPAAAWVAALTKDARLPEDEREAAYEATLARAPVEVQLIKLADTLDNLHDAGSRGAPPLERTLAKALRLVAALAPGAPAALQAPLDLVRRRIAELGSAASGAIPADGP
jgi:(p)ppGpp synthase/HD superfamily hydrolase